MMDFYLSYRNIVKLHYLICNAPCDSAVFNFILSTDFAVTVITMHTLEYSGHVEYDRNNNIMNPKVNTAAYVSNRGPVEHNLEPDNGI